MKFATIRSFRVNASAVLRDAKDDEVLITKNGIPSALLIPISDKEDIDLLRQAINGVRFKQKLVSAWKESEKKGISRMSMEEIDAEIQAYRKEKTSKDRT